MSSGRMPLSSNLTVCVTASSRVEITVTLEPSSLVTHSSPPSGVKAMRRGRLATAMFFTTWPLAVSITCTVLATSEVT